MADSQGYVRLSSNVESPTAAQASTGQQGFFFPTMQYNGTENTADSEDELVPHKAKVASWWRLKSKPMVANQASGNLAAESAYLTLIPLSDSRLRPPRTKLIVGCLLLLAAAAVSTVYVLVPRGVTVGTIQVHSSQISFNTSKSTYQILLTATIPVYNPNYLSVMLSGSINVSFYDQQAGYTPVAPVRVPARASPQVITVGMDASSVPQKYLFTIYTQCFTFPEKLIFFLNGNLRAAYLGSTFNLPLIDNYFIISCNQGGDDEDDDKPPHHHHPHQPPPPEPPSLPAAPRPAERPVQRHTTLPAVRLKDHSELRGTSDTGLTGSSARRRGRQ